MNKITTGLCLAIVSIILGSLFFVGGYHTLYWSHPAVFITLTIVGVFSALCGGFLIGKNLPHIQKRRGALPVFLVGLGALFAVVGGLLGLFAILVAFDTAINTGYWGEPFYGYGDYGGDWMFMGFQIVAFQMCIFLGIIGSFLVGLGLQKRG